jgi:hypothetical protein
MAPGYPFPPFSKRHDVDIVVHPDGRAIAGAEAFADRVVVPAWHDRRRHRSTRAELDRSRHSHADTQERSGQRSTIGPKMLKDLVNAAKDGLRPIANTRGFGFTREDPAAYVREGDVHAGGPQ